MNTTDPTTFTSLWDVQAHVCDLLGSEGTEADAIVMTELLHDNGALTQTDSGLWELADLSESAWLNLLDKAEKIASIIGMSIPAAWDSNQSVFACADCSLGFFSDKPNGTIVNEDGDVVAGAEWITDPTNIPVGQECETCKGVCVTTWNGSEWMSA